MIRRLYLTLAFVLALFQGLTACAPAALAHPHVFVDVTLRFLPDEDGRLTGVEVIWRYDDFFSLLLLEDMGLDPDGDMELSGEERAALKGFDLVDWPEGFEGALFLETGGAAVALDPPEALDAAIAAEADFAGLVFFPPSPRHVDTYAAAALAAHGGGKIGRVGLFVDADDGLLRE